MIGRKKETEELNELYASGKAELVAIYGRRRVGKTYLVNNVFKDKITFGHAGLAPDENESAEKQYKGQLEQFYSSLLLCGMVEGSIPKNWIEAFLMLEKLLMSKNTDDRQVVFLDELPWMDTPGSDFLKAFEGFWNIWGCHRDNLMVIVCGSANSWILDKLINNHGGLYNRVTYEIKLLPFSLHECEEFYKSKHIGFTRYDIVQSYMAVGGTPYYMGYMKRGLSLAQNIDRLFYEKGAKLNDEYVRLFSSVFDKPHLVERIVRFLSTRNYGYTRAEISEGTGISSGGWLSEILRSLLASDMIVKYVPFDVSKRKEHYRLVDPFCIFYLKYVEGNPGVDESFWQKNHNTQSVVSWRGIAFENVCFNHIKQIKTALGVSGVTTSHSAWIRNKDGETGLQIDLLIMRNDNVVNMCEIKFLSDDFTVDEKYYRVLLRRQDELVKKVSRKTSVQSTLITTFGLKKNEYSGIFSNTVTLEDLFTI